MYSHLRANIQRQYFPNWTLVVSSQNYAKHLIQLTIKFLFTKLEKYGIRGVGNDWFASYLSNRRQFVSLFGTNSDYQTVTLLQYLRFHLLADGTNLFFNNPNILNLEISLNVEPVKVSQWCYANKLSLNIEKTALCYSILRIEE